MALCKVCGKETMNQRVRSCRRADVEFPDGTKLAAVAFVPPPMLSREEWMEAWMRNAERTGDVDLVEARRRYGHYTRHWNRCGGCNVMAGGTHHAGCDVERCPRCKGQLISCGCLTVKP